MPRSEARIFVSIWDDEDFLNLSVSARYMYYVVLLTQPDMSHCGVIPLREERWAKKSRQSLDEVCAALKELESAGWTVTDHVTRELFARSLVRRDKILRQPKMWTTLAAAIGQVDSVRIRTALLCELTRTRDEGAVNKSVLGPLQDLIARMERQLDTLSGTQPATHRATHPDTRAGTNGVSDAGTDALGHPATLLGKGARNGSSTTGAPFPRPLTPSPLPCSAGAGKHAADPAGATAEGEGSPDSQTEALIAKIRALRPEWASASIRRSLLQASVLERPRELVAAAAILVARDPASQSPGRLEHDGPWWYQPPAVPKRDLLPWCGKCDQRTRLRGFDADEVSPCPDCHAPARREAG